MGQREVRQAGRKLADHAYTGGLAVEQADEDRGHDRDDQGRRYAGCQTAQQQHRARLSKPVSTGASGRPVDAAARTRVW